MKRTLPFLALAILAALPALAAEFPKVGAPAPAFELTSDQGKVLKLTDLGGKWVVLYFYPKDFTGGCTIQARGFQRDLEKYQGRNAEIVGVSVDSAESHKSFCEKEGLNFRLLSDPDATVSTAYNSVMVYEGTKLSSRNTFLIDPSGKIARVFPSVKPTGHSEEVLTALDELGAKK
ncbi:MAG: peroxiredoxin [Thermoanaerobaculia bacterium]